MTARVVRSREWLVTFDTVGGNRHVVPVRKKNPKTAAQIRRAASVVVHEVKDLTGIHSIEPVKELDIWR